MSLSNDDLEPDDFSIGADESIEVVDTTELVTEPQSDTGSSPNGLLQNRLVRVSHPGGVEEGENNWHKRQIVRRPWERR